MSASSLSASKRSTKWSRPWSQAVHRFKSVGRHELKYLAKAGYPDRLPTASASWIFQLAILNLGLPKMCSPKDVHVTVTHVYHEAHETAG